MPNRTLREDILNSERINALTPEEELFYRRLMSVVDDYGRIEAHPQILLTKCYPFQLDRVSAQQVSAWLATCSVEDGQQEPLITVYEVAGKKYLQINNFKQRERFEKYPGPPQACATPSSGAPRAARATITHSTSPTHSIEVSSVKEKTGNSENLAAYSSALRLAEFEQIDERWLSAGFSGPEDFEGWFREVYAAHPARGGLGLAKDTLRGAVFAGKLTKSSFETGYAKWRESRDWKRDRGRFIPQLAKFGSDEGWAHPPIEQVEERGEF